MKLEIMDPEVAVVAMDLEPGHGQRQQEDSPDHVVATASTAAAAITNSVTNVSTPMTMEFVGQPSQLATPPSPATTISCSTSRSPATGEPPRRVSRSGRTKKPHQCKAKVAEKMKEIEGKDKIIKAQKIAIKSYQEQLVSALQNTIRLQECIVKFNEKEVKRLRREVRRLQGQARPRIIPGSGLNRWSLWGCD